MVRIETLLEQADASALAQLPAAQIWEGIPAVGLPGGDGALLLLIHYLLLEPQQQQRYPLAAMLAACPAHPGDAWDRDPGLVHTDVRHLIQMMRHHQAWVTDERNHPRDLPTLEVNRSALRAFQTLDEGLAPSTFRDLLLTRLCAPWDEIEASMTAVAGSVPYRRQAACLLADFRASGLTVGGWCHAGSLETLLTLLQDDPERRWNQAIGPRSIHPRAQGVEVMHGRLAQEVWEAVVAGRHEVQEPQVLQRYPEVLARWRAQQLAEQPAPGPGGRGRRRA